MDIEVKYFGMIAEKLGKEIETIQVESNSLPLNLREFFCSKYPQLSSMTFQVAVDQELLNILNGKAKTIALLPPFAGG